MSQDVYAEPIVLQNAKDAVEKHRADLIRLANDSLQLASGELWCTRLQILASVEVGMPYFPKKGVVTLSFHNTGLSNDKLMAGIDPIDISVEDILLRQIDVVKHVQERISKMQIVQKFDESKYM